MKKICAGTDQWCEERKIRISASIVRRAMSMTNNYLNYIKGKPQTHIGVSIEMTIIENLPSYLFRTGIWVREDHQWLMATPDGFHKSLNIPVEVKYNWKGTPLKQVMKKHYPQLQLQMFCTNKQQLLLIVYDGMLSTTIVQRDESYINKLLYRLRIALQNGILNAPHNCGPVCKTLQQLLPLSLDKLSHKKRNIILNSRRRNYTYRTHNLMHLFPQFNTAKYNSLLSLLRAKLKSYFERVEAKRQRLLNA